MNYWIIIGCGLLGMGIGFLGVPLVLRAVESFNISKRSQDFHHGQQAPVPRFGGLVLAGAFVGVVLFRSIFCWIQGEWLAGIGVITLSSLAMFILGFWDDIKPLGAKRKLIGQILIAGTAYACGVGIERFLPPFAGQVIELHNWGAIVTVLWLVGMTNLINLIDGVDGLAGGICLMLMALLAYVGYQSGGFGGIAIGMAGALAAFLWFNFPPARIYLGDGGAYFLGFLIGVLSIVSSHKGTVFAALVAPLFVLALPILDTTLAILRRGLRGLPIFRPDRKHIHHHLLAMGMSRRRAVLWIYGVTLIFLAMGFAAYISRGDLIPLLLGGTIIILLIFAGRLSFSREWFAVGRIIGNSLRMRQEVHYALTLTRWLALDGERCASIEELWSDLVFVAQKLGFTRISLTLADGQRTWEQNGCCNPNHSVQHVLQGGRFGIIEITAPDCRRSSGDPALACPQPPGCPRPFYPSVSDETVFGIISDLLAEGWIKAATRWSNGEHTPIRFDGKAPLPANQQQSPSSQSRGPAPVSAAGSKAAEPH